MQKLSVAQIAPVRLKLTAEQNGLCALCEGPIVTPCLDHCHSTGTIRGVLCRGCNAMLGHIENNMPRNHLTDLDKLGRWGKNLAGYIAKFRNYPRPWLHPTHKTEDDKKAKRAVAAKKRRAAAKVAE